MNSEINLFNYKPTEFCCDYKKNLLVENNLFDTIKIDPKFLIFQDSNLNRYPNIFKWQIHVENKFYFRRSFQIHADFPNFLTYNVLGSLHVVPDLGFTIEVLLDIQLLKQLKKNCKRYVIFITSDHPKIKIEIPVFIIYCLPPEINMSIPREIQIPDTAPSMLSYYSFPVYNSYPDPVIFNFKHLQPELQKYFQFYPSIFTIQPKKICYVFLVAYSDNFCPIRTALVVRAKNMKMQICIEKYLTTYKPFLSTKSITFPETVLGTHNEIIFKLCNDYIEPIRVKWCRHESLSKAQRNSENLSIDKDLSIIKYIDSTFGISPKFGQIQSNASIECKALFTPEIEVPKQNTKSYPFGYENFAFLAVNTEHEERLPFLLKGSAVGADIRFVTECVNFDQIYIGERNFKEIVVKNFSDIPATVSFLCFDSIIQSHLCISPKNLTLEPKEPKIFVIAYYAKVVGNFLDKITFQIQNGHKRFVTLKGTSIGITVKKWDSSIEFGNVPMCIVQKKSLMIANPLSVPVTVQFFMKHDGDEKPLMLELTRPVTSKLRDVEPTFTIKTDILKELHDFDSLSTVSSFWIYESNLNLVEKSNSCPTFPDKPTSNAPTETWAPKSSILSFLSTCKDFVQIEDDLKNNLSGIALRLLKQFKEAKFVEKSDGDVEVVKRIVEEFKPYYEGKVLDNWHSFEHLDWSLNQHPKEFIIETHATYLRPYESKSVDINLIPNRPGAYRKQLVIFCTPVQLEENKKFCNIPHTEIKVDPNYLMTKIDSYHICTIPDIVILNPVISFGSVYVEYYQPFEIIIKNTTDNPGFVYCTSIPIDEGQIKIYLGKYFIAGGETKTILAYALFSKVQQRSILAGLLTVLGSVRPMSFKVITTVLPPKIKVTPTKIKIKDKVLIEKNISVVIENICPTKARISIKFHKKMKFLQLHPTGAILAPGQSLLVTITTKFLDAGHYRNKLIIDLEHSGSVFVPMTFLVDDLPISFNPELVKGLNMGTQFCTNQDIKIPIEVSNTGEKIYRLSFRIAKPRKDKNSPIFSIVPNNLKIFPRQKESIILFVEAKNTGEFLEYLTVDALYETSRLRWFTSELRADFIKPICKWSKDNIQMMSNKQMVPKDRILSEKVSIKSMSSLPFFVHLRVKGEFFLENDEEIFKLKEFTLQPSEIVHFKVCFKEEFVSGSKNFETEYLGYVLTMANEFKQKSLHIQAVLEYPTFKLFGNENIYFTRFLPFFARFPISNCGKIKGSFNWELTKEEISQADYIETVQMSEIQNISEYILSKPLMEILKNSIDVEDEYLKTIYNNTKFYDKLDEKADWEEQTTNETGVEPVRRMTKKILKDGRPSQFKPKKSILIKETVEEESLTPKKTNMMTVTTEEIFAEIRKYFVPVEDVELNEKPTLKYDSVYDSYFKNISKNYITTDKISNNDSKAIVLDRYKGILDSCNETSINFLYQHLEHDLRLETTYTLEVFGGESQNLQITIFELDSRIEISTTVVNLGIQPWYKQFVIPIQFYNPNNIQHFVQMFFKNFDFWKGYVNMKELNNFWLESNMLKEIKFDTMLGFSKYFQKDAAIEINYNIPVLIKFNGSGKMPMVSILNVKRPKLGELDKTIAYKTLNEMYKKSVQFRPIVKHEPIEEEIIEFLEYLKKMQSVEETIPENKRLSMITSTSIQGSVELTEEEEEQHLVPESSYIVLSTDGSIRFDTHHNKPKQRASVIEQMDDELVDFIVFDCPRSYPNHLEIEHAIETEIYLNIIDSTKESRKQFKKILKRCIIEGANHKYIPANKFVVQPIHHYVSEYDYNFGDIHLGSNNERKLSLIFHGPGIVILSVRSEDRLMDFKVDFDSENMSCNKDDKVRPCTYHMPHILAPNSWYRYRNRIERKENCLPEKCEDCYDCRDFCGNCQIKLCHAHSYDFDLHLIHRRGIKDVMALRKQIYAYYDKLNQSAFRAQKDPWVLAEFYPNIELFDNNDMEIELKITFNPSEEYYSAGTIFDEYLFIDVHLGPTIPIHVYGKFKNPKSSSEEISFVYEDGMEEEYLKPSTIGVRSI